MYRIMSMNDVTNRDVTSYYMGIIHEGLKKSQAGAEWFSMEHPPSRKEVLVHPTVLDAHKMSVLGFRQYGVWIQGILPEESLMKHNSKLRYWLLSMLEKHALKRAKLLFVVSNEMVEHLQDKYNIDIRSKTFIIPCFNTDVSEASFSNPERYNQKIFTYVGSLSKWQCFDETLAVYAKLTRVLDGCELRVFTPSVNEAKARAKGIASNIYVDYLPDKQLQEEMRKVTFGFIVRDDSIVNRVATPTKISTYLANGVIPIYSSTLKSFSMRAREMKYAFALDNNLSNLDELIAFCNHPINIEALKQEITSVFTDYYNREKYVEEIAERFGSERHELYK